VRRPSHGELQRAEHRCAPRERVSLRHAGVRLHALRRVAGPELPHPDLQRDRSQERRLRAYHTRTAPDVRGELRTRLDHRALIDPGAVLTLRGRLAWAHDWVNDPSLAAVFQTLPGASFIVNGAVPAKDAALVSAGAELRLVNGVTLLGKFDGEFASHAQTY